MIDSRHPDYDCHPSSLERPKFFYSRATPEVSPDVSIITPFYNTGAVFHETAKAVFQQSLQQWEWIIVNDGSSDSESLEILNNYRRLDPRMRVIDRPVNEGPSAARNHGFKSAKAHYVVLLDSDNLIEPTTIEKWRWFLESHPEYSFVKGYSVGFGSQTYLWNEGFHSGKAFLNANQVDTTSMIRKDVHASVGGYDETIRQGLEDWDFWLRCANAGFWGGTVPEYLDWYRRRADHSVRWSNWDEGSAQASFHSMLRARYPNLWNGGFPKIAQSWHMPNATLSHVLPFENRLLKEKPRLLMIVPWLTAGGADKFNLDLVRQIRARGWEVSIATTLTGDNSWHSVFARETPDIFILDHFLRLVDYPRFLRYLIESRDIDVVCMSHSEFGYLVLPYLRAHCPRTAFMDFCHIEEPDWKNGGYPNMAIECDELMDVHVVSSDHLKNWMTARGGAPERVLVSYTNVDVEDWRPDHSRRDRIRRELGLGSDIPVILYAARLCPQKQPQVFAQTVLNLHKQGHRFAAIVAGNGPDFGWLADFVATKNLAEDVLLLGMVSTDKMKDLMAAADIFFLPSLWEGIALTFYEAMAAGLAIVGADVGGQKELLTPECGVLITPGTKASEVAMYTAALTELLNDQDKRIQMGRAGRQRVCAHFRIEDMGNTMLDSIRRAQNLHKTSPRALPSPGLAQACASMAVEYTRICRVADQLWNNHSAPTLWRVYFYERLRTFEPAYSWFVKLGFKWLVPLKDRAKRLLVSAS